MMWMEPIPNLPGLHWRVKANVRRLRKAIPLKWEWRLVWEQGYQTGPELTWHQRHIIFNTRREMRQHKRNIETSIVTRNFETQRRLVQADWENYVDTFTYNAKGNGNGR